MRILVRPIVLLPLAVAAGLLAGHLIPPGGMGALLALRQVSGQLVFYMVPFIIIAFVAPSIAMLKGSVSRALLTAFALAWCSTVTASLLAALAGRRIVPLLGRLADAGGEARQLPDMLLRIDIEPVMSVMSALVLAVLLGLGTLWTGSQPFERALTAMRDMVGQWVGRVLMPLLPLYVFANFAALAYEGTEGRLLVFLPVIAIVVAFHCVWIGVLYLLAALASRRNSLDVLRHYGPAYLTALGTMSSAATLGVALRCARRSRAISPATVDFAIPLFSNIHLCGSALTETFFVMVVSNMLYGSLPEEGTLTVFVVLLGVFAVGAPGVPGGTVLASLGIVEAVLGFDDAGTAMLIAVFALQDSFGTACNITADGALALITDRCIRPRPQGDGEKR